MESRSRSAKIAAIQRRYDAYLMGLPGVVGTGIGYRQRNGVPTAELCLVVMVSQKLDRKALEAEAIVPRELDGVPLDVIETGAFVI